MNSLDCSLDYFKLSFTSCCQCFAGLARWMWQFFFSSEEERERKTENNRKSKCTPDYVLSQKNNSRTLICALDWFFPFSICYFSGKEKEQKKQTLLHVYSLLFSFICFDSIRRITCIKDHYYLREWIFRPVKASPNEKYRTTDKEVIVRYI